MIIDTTQTKIEREMHTACYMLKLLKDLEYDRQRIDMLYGSKFCGTGKPIRVSSSEIAALAAGER